MTKHTSAPAPAPASRHGPSLPPVDLAESVAGEEDPGAAIDMDECEPQKESPAGRPDSGAGTSAIRSNREPAPQKNRPRD